MKKLIRMPRPKRAANAKITVRLDAVLHNAVREAALDNDETLTTLVRRALWREVGRSKR